ncbi:pyrimidine reductase family protein [Microbacterium horticulturae]|uniref:Pyrimidine reductase family protein n=1 Tax=Microbacterium horticulturae TaxID=3028316 RepID=A0ABY8C4V5_9MICO|nr:pyrimidine reductase family protein [Microbacterium sp. KACC 23027]WEG09868.1 pyrimidine reductase family protein [Microbacterium sp. KACC 23027]
MITDDELRSAYGVADRTEPHVRMNFVASADGSVTLGGRSGTLGGDTDRRLMQVLRSMCDVVLVGAGTVRAEGYAGVTPRLAIVSARLLLSPDDPALAEAAVRPIVITSQAAPASRREELDAVADVIVCGTVSVDLRAVVRELAARGMPQILCEGGPHLFGSLLDADVVDELCLTLSPRLVGGDAGRIAQGAEEADRHFGLRSVLHDDEGYVLLRYAR